MIHFDAIDWLRAFLILGSFTVFVVFSWRYFSNYRDLSRGQKQVVGALLLFIVSQGWRSIEAIVDNDGFKGALIPFIVGLALCFSYLADPASTYRKRLGNDPFDPEESMEELLAANQKLRLQNEELRDQAYNLAVRSNELRLELYGKGDLT